MNITVNSQALAVELRLLNKVVPSKPVITILSHVLLRAGDDGLTIYATDMEVGLTCPCAARIETPGTAALPAAKLLAMVEQFPDGDVNISLDKGHATIRCGAFRSRLQAQLPEDFPQAPAVDGASCQIEASALSWLLGKARHATASTATRQVLQGALLKMSGQAAAMVATDGKRLVLATVAREGPDVELVIPVKAMDALAGQLEDGTVDVTIGPRHLFFAMNGRLLTSRTIDSKFPAYERIVPRQNVNRVTFDRATLIAALRRVILAAEESGGVIMSVSPAADGAPGRMELSSKSAGIGSADEAIRVEYDGEPLRVCANGEHVLDFLGVASEPTMTMALKDANGAALFEDGRECFSVIMLMRG